MASFDERLAAELEGDFEGLIAQLREAMTSTVKVKVDDPCPNPKCNCKHIRYVEVPDYKEKRSLAEWWFARVEGRPGQKEGEVDDERIVFQRLVDYGDDAS